MLLQRSPHGLEFFGESKVRFANQILQLLQISGMKRMIAMLELLEEMSKSQEVRKLTLNPVQGLSAVDSLRMQTILVFLLENYSREIRLEEVSNLVEMSQAGFCRYLKSRTQKTLIELVNEFRINQACKLLRESERKIVEISFEVGFSNLSNFNRQFKNHIGMTPISYRKIS
jgi:AraC-like DNA-binding protein